MSETLVHGIPCISCNSVFLEAIDSTLHRIRVKAPKDYDRITSLVNAFEACEMENECTCGQWVALHGSREDGSIWSFSVDGVPGRVLLNRNLQTHVASPV